MGLTIIMGNMFSGKTSELIRRLKRYKVLNKKVVVINSSKDTRSPEEVINTHDGVQFPCLKVDHISHCIIKESFCNADIVAIDEAQFFTNLKEFVEMCLFLNKSVIIAGLDGDYKQRKFGEVIDCIPPGPFTKRIVQNDDLELVGGNDMYKAVCRRHLKSMDIKDEGHSFLQTAFHKAMESRMVE